jgi:hypothetical protein
LSELFLAGKVGSPIASGCRAVAESFIEKSASTNKMEIIARRRRLFLSDFIAFFVVCEFMCEFSLALSEIAVASLWIGEILFNLQAQATGADVSNGH